MGLGRVIRGFADFAQSLYKRLSPDDLRKLAKKLRARDENSTGIDDFVGEGLEVLANLLEAGDSDEAEVDASADDLIETDGE